MSSNKIVLSVGADVKNAYIAGMGSRISWKPDYHQYFMKEAGEEHYKLLAHLSSQLPKGTQVVDLGTLYGSSALALASNPDVSVVTYDIHECIPDKYKAMSVLGLPNVKQIIKDGVEAVTDYASFTPLIVLDIDPHDGVQEKRTIEALIKQGYQGVVVCDDINLNDGMKAFWQWVPAEIKKYDVSKYGHWSGTGILVFDPEVVDVTIQ